MTKKEIKEMTTSKLILKFTEDYGTILLKHGLRCIGVSNEWENIGNELMERGLLDQVDFDRLK